MSQTKGVTVWNAPTTVPNAQNTYRQGSPTLTRLPQCTPVPCGVYNDALLPEDHKPAAPSSSAQMHRKC